MYLEQDVPHPTLIAQFLPPCTYVSSRGIPVPDSDIIG
jgi:hypothetical protein